MRSRWILPLGLSLVFYGIVYMLIQSGVLRQYHLQVLSLAAIHVMLVASLNLINGFTGQFSLGHAGFFAIGAYLSGYLTLVQGFPFAVALLIGGMAASIIGIAIGLPAFRLRGDYLAISTLGFGEIIRVTILNIRAVGGARGFSGIPRHTTFELTFICAVLTVLLIRNFLDSDHGRACLAIRDDEIASKSLGINTTFYKGAAFAIGSFFAGIAGGLFVHYMQYIAPTPGQIGFLKSIDILIMAVLGGLGSLTGSVIAAVGLTLLPEFLRGFAEYRMVIYPILLLLVMLFRPQGLMAGNELSFAWLDRQYRKLKGGRAHASQR